MTDNSIKRNVLFEKLVQFSSKGLADYLLRRLNEKFPDTNVVSDGFIYHKGTFPVLICAHMDTVHKELVDTIVYANESVCSPEGIGGDDRCGVWMILRLLQYGYDPHIVFLEDEEIGCVGAKKFAASKTMKELKENGGIKYIIEFDRKNSNDAVYYNCDNKEFDEFITKEYFEKAYGTSSDICYIAPELGVAAVNLSCGYYEEHTLYHYVILKEMYEVAYQVAKIFDRTKKIMEEDGMEPFKYVKCESSLCSYRSYGRGGYYYDYYDDCVDYNYNRRSKTYLCIYNENNELKYNYSYAVSLNDAIVLFMKSHETVCYKDIVSFDEYKMEGR